MKTRKGDFVEIDFVAFVKEGNIFDTTKQEEAKKAGLFDEKRKHEFKPMVVCIGEGMVIRGLDKELEDKEVGKDYEVEIAPKEAFGQRLPNLIKTVPLSAFRERPVPGTFVSVDGVIARVAAVTGGRALIDLNNPLAGKRVVYKFRINRIIEDKTENIKSLGRFFRLDIKEITLKENVFKIKLKGQYDKEHLDLFKKKIKELLKVESEIE